MPAEHGRRGVRVPPLERHLEFLPKGQPVRRKANAGVRTSCHVGILFEIGQYEIGGVAKVAEIAGVFRKEAMSLFGRGQEPPVTNIVIERRLEKSGEHYRRNRTLIVTVHDGFEVQEIDPRRGHVIAAPTGIELTVIRADEVKACFEAAAARIKSET